MRREDRSDLGTGSISGPSAASLVRQLEQLQMEMRTRHAESVALLDRVHPSRRQSAANLLDYLTLRGHDLRSLQESLAHLGLSSLGRSEEHVITTIERVLSTLRVLAGDGPTVRTESAIGFGAGRSMLEANADDLLGPSRAGRPTRIMVTMPTEAATDIDLVRRMVANGMDSARINCAHDDPSQWTRMIENIHAGAAEAGRTCPILMDLPGPKLRTGPIRPGPRVLRLHPARDALGHVISPGRVRFVADDQSGGPQPVVPVPREWLSLLRPGDRIELRDARGARRVVNVTSVDASGTWVSADHTTYLTTGTTLVGPNGVPTVVGPLPPLEQALVVRPGDLLTLGADLEPADPEDVDQVGVGEAVGGSPPARRVRIGCTLPELFDAVAPGHRIYFDDGTIGGVVEAVRPEEADVRIVRASEAGSKLKAEKGINAPDTALLMPAVGPADEAILCYIATHADLIGLSFVQQPSDVVALQSRLHDLGAARLGVVLKIETVRGFSELPNLLLAAMATPRLGVMVARGDLAVECGFERLAEVQEEILWLCDAAHVPVIWATQVLDQMARTGQPSRAEISDAAMGGRAECVMLNKGPFIAEAVAALDDILRRMTGHQQKKVALLRRLHSWSDDER